MAASAEIIPLTGLGQFPTRRDKFVLAYAESASAIDFMVRTWGRAALVTLIGSYATGVTDDVAFGRALGVDVAAFGDAWLTDIGASKPVAQGPRPDPPGPLPPGWSAVPAGSVAPAPPSASLSSTPNLRAPIVPVATPGVAATDQGGAAGDGVAWLFALVAVVLAAAGIGLVLVRQRHRDPR